jgi:hypothetical protein
MSEAAVPAWGKVAEFFALLRLEKWEFGMAEIKTRPTAASIDEYIASQSRAGAL